MSNLTERLDMLRKEIQKDDFLDGKGLSNEVNIRIFDEQVEIAPELLEATPLTLCEFALSHEENAQILLLFSLTGDSAATGGGAAVLTVTIKENGAAAAAFRQKLDGVSTVASPFLLTNREKGVTNVTVEASVSGGQMALERYGAFASALVLE